MSILFLRYFFEIESSIRCSHFWGKTFQAGIRKHRAILAHIKGTHVAPAALADAAFHAVLQGGVNLVIGKTQLEKVLDHEFYHDRRAAGYGNGVLRTRMKSQEIIRNKAHEPLPSGLSRIDGEMHAHILPFFEGEKFILIA